MVNASSTLLRCAMTLALFGGVAATAEPRVVATTAQVQSAAAGRTESAVSNTVKILVEERTQGQPRFELMQLVPGGTVTSAVDGTRCGGGTTRATFAGQSLAAATLAPLTALAIGTPLVVTVTAPEANLDPAARDGPTVRALSGVDEEHLSLLETASDSGVFNGLLQTRSVPPAAVSEDCVLSMPADEAATIAVALGDSEPFASATIAIRSGIDSLAFDSATGDPVPGTRLTLVDATTGAHARRFAPDGTTVLSPTVESDASGRFRLGVLPSGRYRVRIEPPSPYVAPSTASPEALSIVGRLTIERGFLRPRLHRRRARHGSVRCAARPDGLRPAPHQVGERVRGRARRTTDLHADRHQRGRAATHAQGDDRRHPPPRPPPDRRIGSCGHQGGPDDLDQRPHNRVRPDTARRGGKPAAPLFRGGSPRRTVRVRGQPRSGPRRFRGGECDGRRDRPDRPRSADGSDDRRGPRDRWRVPAQSSVRHRCRWCAGGGGGRQVRRHRFRRPLSSGRRHARNSCGSDRGRDLAGRSHRHRLRAEHPLGRLGHLPLRARHRWVARPRRLRPDRRRRWSAPCHPTVERPAIASDGAAAGGEGRDWVSGQTSGIEWLYPGTDDNPTTTRARESSELSSSTPRDRPSPSSERGRRSPRSTPTGRGRASTEPSRSAAGAAWS